MPNPGSRSHKGPAKPKFYAVRRGFNPGVYDSWPICQQNITGFRKAEFKSFATRVEAEIFVHGGHAAINAQESAGSTGSTSSLVFNAKKLYPTNQEVDPDGDVEDGNDAPWSSAGDAADCLAALHASPEANQTVDPPLFVFTDGSCLGNGRASAKAGIGVYFGEEDPRNISERLPGTPQTNNRAELLAVIRAIRAAYPGSNPNHPDLPRRLVVYSDSQYMRDGISKWLPGWKRKNWKTSTGSDVKNKDLWVQLEFLKDRFKDRIEFVYVPAHSNVPGNESADALAKLGAQQRRIAA
ncbi:hypothetical protein HKX48_006041 [Thoreauomyces humboldtii]|nr:hypothetical protein HKX48_006041 [Thoreauomyces humboldtii]